MANSSKEQRTVRDRSEIDHDRALRLDSRGEVESYSGQWLAGPEVIERARVQTRVAGKSFETVDDVLGMCDLGFDIVVVKLSQGWFEIRGQATSWLYRRRS